MTDVMRSLLISATETNLEYNSSIEEFREDDTLQTECAVLSIKAD